MAAFEARILQSPYGDTYRERLLLSRAPLGRRLERLISIFAEDRLEDLRRWAQGELKGLLAVLSLQSDIENGQLFMRGLGSSQRFRRSAMLAYGDLRGPFWRGLRDCQGDRAQIAELCRYHPSPLSSYLWEALELLENSGALWAAEIHYLGCCLALGREILSHIGGDNGAVVADYLRRLTDLWNLRLWLGVQRNPEAAAIQFLPGGNLTENSLRSAKTVSALLRGTLWKLPSEAEESALLVLLERQFFAWQLAQRRLNPLGIQVSLAYMARQLLEWRNLGIILVGLQSPIDRRVLYRGLTLME